MKHMVMVISIVTAAAVPAVGGAQSQPAVMAQLEPLLRKAAKYKSCQARVRVEVRVEKGKNLVERQGKGRMWILRKDGRVLYRREMSFSTQTQIGEQRLKLDQKELVVDDGRVRYVLHEGLGRKSAVKTRSVQADEADLRALVERLARRHTLKSLGKRKVEGVEVLAIEARPRNADGKTPAFVTELDFSLEHGVLVRMLRHDTEGHSTQSTVWSDFVFDQPTDPKLFRFKPPEGVKVIDRTGG